MACSGALWSMWRCLWNIGHSEWMVLCVHATSWFAGRHLRVSIVRLSSLCNVCFLGPMQGVMNQIRGSRDTPPPPNPEPCTEDPHEVIQVGVMSLPWRNDLQP